jgi:hypothetical protein
MRGRGRLVGCTKHGAGLVQGLALVCEQHVINAISRREQLCAEGVGVGGFLRRAASALQKVPVDVGEASG